MATVDSTALLVVWDVDLTLVQPRGFGHDVAFELIRRRFGVEPVVSGIYAGRTDRSIYAEILTSSGVSETEVSDFLSLLGPACAQEARRRWPVEALPGAAAALAAVADITGVTQTIVTGNVPEVGRLKVELTGLDRWLDLALAGFGDEHEQRERVLSGAIDRWRGLPGADPTAPVVAVGDTGADVLAARACGAGIVGVCTGNLGCDGVGGADVVLPDLSDPDAVVAAVIRAAYRSPASRSNISEA